MANIKMPAGRDLGTEYSKTLSAQMNIMPNMFGAQAEWGPLQSSTQLQNINSLLLGTPDINYDTRTFSPATYRQGQDWSYGAIPRGVQGLINYPSLPDPRGSSGRSGGSGMWLPPGVPGIPGISGSGAGGFPWGGSNGGGFSLKRDGRGLATGIGRGGNDGGVAPGYNGLTKSFSMDGMPPHPPDPLMDLFGGGGDNRPPRRLMTPSGYVTTSHTQPGQQGLLSLYENYLAPTMERSQEAMMSSQRASDIADVGNLGPAAMAALRASDPGSAGLIDTATEQAQHELGMGGQLTAPQLRQATQAVRARGTGMLGGTGSAGDLNEAMGIGAYGQALQQGRRGYAGQVLGQRQSFYGDPFSRILGRPGAGMGSSSNALSQAMGLSGQGGPLGMMNPESRYAQDVYSGNWNGLWNAAIGNANNQNALIGAGINAFGSLAGAGMGAMI